MQIPVYPAKKWNELCDLVRGAWPFPGLNCRLGWRSGRITLEGSGGVEWAHPWHVRCTFERFTDAGGRISGEWRAYVRPGFVNGRDTFVDMPQDWPDRMSDEGGTKPVALTDEPAPFLRLTDWRNPIASSGVSASASGEILFGKGEGYPAYFEQLGVKPPARGGKFAEGAYDPERSREIRAIDLVLTKPRLGSALGVELLSAIGDAQTHSIETTFTNAYYVSSGGRSKLRATSKFRPFGEGFTTTPFLSLPMNAGDPQTDEIKVGTVFIVSPPEVPPDAVPDETWTPYPRNDLFWNLSHATRFVPPAAGVPPVRLVTGLGAGVLDLLADAMLAPINSGLNEVGAFLNQADMRGMFWTI